MTIQKYASCTLFAIFGIILFAMSGCGGNKTAEDQPTLVRSVVVKLNSFDQTANYAGEVKGRYESQLAFQVGGRIVRRNVELGNRVNTGDVLMEIDPKDVQQAVAITSAQVYSAQSQLILAENNLKRYRTLFEQGAVSRAQYEQYEASHAAALAATRQAAAQNTQGANQLGYTALRANNDGVISSITAEAGQVVGAGQSVLTLVQDGEREVEIDVPENRYKDILNAKEIKISFWALPDQVVSGSVREISPIADKTSRTYKVRISLKNPPPELNLGMTASVSTALNGQQNSTYIPLSAIYQTGAKPSVWVVTNNSASLRTVTLGAFGDGTAQVISGLKNNEVIITAGVHKIKEGQKVRLAGEIH
jgi:membrane fusion protein, multidrug efflux system